MNCMKHRPLLFVICFIYIINQNYVYCAMMFTSTTKVQPPKICRPAKFWQNRGDHFEGNISITDRDLIFNMNSDEIPCGFLAATSLDNYKYEFEDPRCVIMVLTIVTNKYEVLPKAPAAGSLTGVCHYALVDDITAVSCRLGHYNNGWTIKII